MSDAFVATAATTDAVAAHETDETHAGGANSAAENRAVNAQLADLAKAVQETLGHAPAREAERDALTLYGVCLCVPQTDEHPQPRMNLLLLSARAGEQHSLKVTEMEGGESAETRLALRNLLGAMQRALTTELDEATADETMQGDTFAYAGANGLLPHHKLSEREFQVIQMLSKGQTVGAISKLLNLSVKTVSTYRVRALKKMNFKTNAELIRYMIQYKLG